MTLGDLVLYGLSGLAVAGALVCVLAREIVRLVAGLGIFLLAVAGLFLYHGMSFLAAAEVFVYVGGVLVLFLFALMLVRSSETGALTVRHDVGAAAVALGLFVLLVATLRGSASALPGASAAGPGPRELASSLLGPMLPVFEITGVLLLVALVAAMVIASRGEAR